MRLGIRTTDVLPGELTRSAPRPLELTHWGIAAIALIIALVAAAVLSGVLLYQRIVRDAESVRLLETEGITAEARVVHIKRHRGENPRVVLTYSYLVEGREYGGETRLRKADRSLYRLGSPLRVRYFASNPAKSWLEGYGPRSTPDWLIVVVPAGWLLCIVPIVAILKRQSQLVANGRSALAQVTRTHKVSDGENRVWRIHYEWSALSGATRSGHFDKHKNPPAVGSKIPILYDRDNARRHSAYPMSLVRAAKR